MVNISSIGIKKGLSRSLSGIGIKESKAATNSVILAVYSASPSSALRAEPTITGVSSPGKPYSERSSLTSISTNSISSSSSTMSALLRKTTM